MQDSTCNELISIQLFYIFAGVAHHNNKITQDKIAEEGAIAHLVELLLNSDSEKIRVEVALGLGCLVLSNHVLQEKMQRASNFTYSVLLDLLEIEDKVMTLM